MTISILLMDCVLVWKSCLWEKEPVITYVRKNGSGKKDKALVDVPGTTTLGGEEPAHEVEACTVEALKLDRRRKNVYFNL